MYETLNKTERLEKLNADLLTWKGKLTTHEKGDVAKSLDLHPHYLDRLIAGKVKSEAITTREAVLAHLSTYYPNHLTK